jgi:hypothetical protein
MPNRLEYSNSLVTWVLENYETLSDGRMPVEEGGYTEYGIRISISKVLGGKFVKPIDLVADIDRALQSLKPTEKGVMIARCISGWTTEQVCFWYGFKSWLEVQNIERYCTRKMRRYLNEGEVITRHNG